MGFEPETSDFNLFILTSISIYAENLSKFAVDKTQLKTFAKTFATENHTQTGVFRNFTNAWMANGEALGPKQTPKTARLIRKKREYKSRLFVKQLQEANETMCSM